MYPRLYEHGDFILHTFGLIVAIAGIVAIVFVRREARRRGLDGEAAADVALITLFVGFAGSRILYVRLDLKFVLAHPFEIIAIWHGGLVWYGGLLAAAPAAIWLARRRNLPPLVMADVLAPAVMLGLAIGRIGCLMAGDDFGKVADRPHWWTLTFTDPHALMPREFLGKPLYPSQPLMGLGAFTIFLILLALRSRVKTPGNLALVMGALYAVHRFFIEMTRGDAIRGFVIPGVLSTSQFVSVVVFPIAVGLLIWRSRRRDKVVAPPAR